MNVYRTRREELKLENFLMIGGKVKKGKVLIFVDKVNINKERKRRRKSERNRINREKDRERERG